MVQHMGLSFSYRSYLKDITPQQEENLKEFKNIFLQWNEKINLISRKDIAHFEIRHVVHSLAIARFIRFNQDAVVLDVGTGGGFPGIPLAIYFPECSFILVDSIAKKANAVQEMVSDLQLKNVKVIRGRVEDIDCKVDYVVSRAVAPMQDLIRWTKNQLVSGQKGSLPNGWLLLKGGDLTEEVSLYRKEVEIQKINQWWKDDFFETKALVYLPRQIIL